MKRVWAMTAAEKRSREWQHCPAGGVDAMASDSTYSHGLLAAKVPDIGEVIGPARSQWKTVLLPRCLQREDVKEVAEVKR